jgi:hypothetical protein
METHQEQIIREKAREVRVLPEKLYNDNKYNNKSSKRRQRRR